MVKLELVESVMEVRRVSARIISMDLVIQGKIMTIISVYGPHCGRIDEEKEKFYDELTTEIKSSNGNCFVMGDCNGHVGTFTNGYDGVHGGFGWGQE